MPSSPYTKCDTLAIHDLQFALRCLIHLTPERDAEPLLKEASA